MFWIDSNVLNLPIRNPLLHYAFCPYLLIVNMDGMCKINSEKTLIPNKIHKLFNSISEIFFKSEWYYLNLNLLNWSSMFLVVSSVQYIHSRWYLWVGAVDHPLLCLLTESVVAMMIWWRFCDGSVSVSSSPGPRVCEDRWHEDRSGGHGHRWHAGALRSVSPHTSTSTTALFSPHLNPSQPLALLSRRPAILVLFAQ